MKNAIKVMFLGFLLCSVMELQAQTANYDVIPQPQQVQLKGGPAFELTASTVIAYPDGNELMRRNAEFLREYIKKNTGLKLGLTTNPMRMNCINLSLNTSLKTGEEGYMLVVDDRGISLMAAAENGIFYGIQTLRKSLPIVRDAAQVALPAVQITDAPRFGYRGIHLDVSRHFFDVDVVKQAIDLYKREVDLIICDEAHRTTGLVLKDKDESNFTKVHRNDFIKAEKRLYMTATPRLYSANIKVKAKENENIDVLCSMDDPEWYGEEFHRLSFNDAVSQGLLSDYKVLVLTVSEEDVPETIRTSIKEKYNRAVERELLTELNCRSASRATMVLPVSKIR